MRLAGQRWASSSTAFLLVADSMSTFNEINVFTSICITVMLLIYAVISPLSVVVTRKCDMHKCTCSVHVANMQRSSRHLDSVHPSIAE